MSTLWLCSVDGVLQHIAQYALVVIQSSCALTRQKSSRAVRSHHHLASTHLFHTFFQTADQIILIKSRLLQVPVARIRCSERISSAHYTVLLNTTSNNLRNNGNNHSQIHWDRFQHLDKHQRAQSPVATHKVLENAIAIAC